MWCQMTVVSMSTSVNGRAAAILAAILVNIHRTQNDRLMVSTKKKGQNQKIYKNVKDPNCNCGSAILLLPGNLAHVQKMISRF